MSKVAEGGSAAKLQELLAQQRRAEEARRRAAEAARRQAQAQARARAAAVAAAPLPKTAPKPQTVFPDAFRGAQAAPPVTAPAPSTRQPTPNVTAAPETAWMGGFGNWLRDASPSLYFNMKRAFGPKETTPVPELVDHNGVTIKTNDCDPDALSETERILDELTAKPEVAQRLRESGLQIDIIPKDKKLTDLPEYAALGDEKINDEPGYGLQTPEKQKDNRAFSGLRGLDGVEYGGRTHVAVGEENLIEWRDAPNQDLYPGNYSTAMHEIAHAVHMGGLDSETQGLVAEAFGNRYQKGGPWVESVNSPKSYAEYFADGTTAYFDRNRGQGHDRNWVKQNDPALYAALEKAYGPRP